MADAQIEKTTATIGISTTDENLISTGEVIKFEGFLKVYVEGTDDENGNGNGKGILPALTIGENLNCAEIIARETFARHAARYTEASLVKKLEEMGIGRPSTFAPTISTIVKRNYVVKESRDGKQREYKLLTLTPGGIDATVETEITGAEKKKLFPTDIGMIVNDFLVEHFPDIVDYSFTANVEEEFDKIANGKEDWAKMIEKFYHPFHSSVEKTADVERPQGRELGVDPASGKKVFARLGKFGPIAQLGESSDDPDAEKPKYASLRRDQLLENISLEDALELFKLPRQVGSLEDQPITVAIGRFGPYVKHDGKFASLTKEDDPYTIEEERAIEIILAKRKADAEKYITVFEENPDIQVINGRYGPYIKAGKKNVKIPKGTDPKSLTLEQCLELAENAPEKKGRGGKRKKK